MKRFSTLVSVVCTVAFVAALTGAGPSGAATFERTIQARDDCDPASFNAAVGPGSCVGDGHVTFDRFIQQLQLAHTAPAWLFLPRQLNVKVGEPFAVENVGGEFHTFTEVADFGGGVVPVLNQLSNAGPVRPECLAPSSDDNIALPPGARAHKSEDTPGLIKYECCIHPWMHAVLKVG